jgi:7-keto-8-aminopelargonate synthetase-like enzyme
MNEKLAPTPFPAVSLQPAAEPVSVPHWLSSTAVAASAVADRFGPIDADAARALVLAQSGSFLHTHHGSIAPVVTLEGRRVVSFSTANYLGLATHPDVIGCARAALAQYGTSMCVGRLSDQSGVQLQLERALAAHLGAPAACVVASGYVANLAVFGHLFGSRDIVVHDRQMHASLLDGWRLSRARRHSFAHNDVHALATVLAKFRGRAGRAVIAVEGLYSVDGDIADLPGLIRVARAHDCLLAIDESHSLGVLGATGGGIAEHWGARPDEVDLRTGSLGKSLAASAGFFAGSAAAVQMLQLTAPTVALSTGAAIPSMAAALGSLAVLQQEPERLVRLRTIARAFRTVCKRLGRIPMGGDDSPIVSFPVGDETLALRLSQRLLEDGMAATPFVFPAVGRGRACLRFMLTSEHSIEQVTQAAEALDRVLRDLGR